MCTAAQQNEVNVYAYMNQLTWTRYMIASHINTLGWIIEGPFKFNIRWICINVTPYLCLFLFCYTINTWLIWTTRWRICIYIYRYIDKNQAQLIMNLSDAHSLNHSLIHIFLQYIFNQSINWTQNRNHFELFFGFFLLISIPIMDYILRMNIRST